MIICYCKRSKDGGIIILRYNLKKQTNQKNPFYKQKEKKLPCFICKVIKIVRCTKKHHVQRIPEEVHLPNYTFLI